MESHTLYIKELRLILSVCLLAAKHVQFNRKSDSVRLLLGTPEGHSLPDYWSTEVKTLGMMYVIHV